MALSPSLEETSTLLSKAIQAGGGDATGVWLLPIHREILADLETPVGAFLKLRQGEHSFLLESVEGGENLARYSFIGTEPVKVLTTGEGFGEDRDPLIGVEEELASYHYIKVPGSPLPSFSGGAVGYCSYDAVKHFEPKTRPFIEKQKDILGIPESAWMICTSLLVFDHVRHTIKVVAHVKVGGGAAAAAAVGDIRGAYEEAARQIDEMVNRLAGSVPVQANLRNSGAPSKMLAEKAAEGGGGGGGGGGGSGSESKDETHDTIGSWTAAEMEEASNVGRAGYEGFVKSLKGHIVQGDIIQAVPSQRLACPLPEGVSSFDVYRQLRVVNPSPYV